MTSAMSSQMKTALPVQTPQRSKSLQVQRTSFSMFPKKPKPVTPQQQQQQQQPKAYKKKKPVVEENKRPVQRRRRSNSAHPVMNYAGPIFNNAPEPGTLPLPKGHNPVESINGVWPHHIPNKIVASHTKLETDPIVAEIQSKLHAVLKLGTSK